MRISEIKALTDDISIKKILSKTWDIEDYRKALEYYNNANCSVYDIFDVLVFTFFEKHGLDPDFAKGYNAEKTILMNLSKSLYHDRTHWAVGTKWIDKIQKDLYSHDYKKRNINKLQPLYGMLNLAHVDKGFDIINMIAVDEDLFNRIFESLPEIDSREELYDIIIDVVLPRIISGEYTAHDYVLLCSISAITYGHKEYWAKTNRIPFDEIKDKFVRN